MLTITLTLVLSRQPGFAISDKEKNPLLISGPMTNLGSSGRATLVE